MKKTIASLLFALSAMGAGNAALAQAAAQAPAPEVAPQVAPEVAPQVAREAAHDAAKAPAGSPAAAAPEFPWLYIVGGVLVAGAGVLVYRSAKGNGRDKAAPTQPPQHSKPGAPRTAPAPAPAPVPAPVAHVNFDANDFLRQAKASFIRMQAAWDKADTADLAKFTTPQILAELTTQIGDRGPDANVTDVIEIQTDLLGVEAMGTDYVASVQFKGTIKPAGAAGPEPFTEVWNMTRAINTTTGWKVSGIKQLS